MAEPLLRALERVRADVLDPDALVRAVLSGRRRGQAPPPWRRVELRWVDLRAGRRLQATAYDATQAHTSNHEPGPAAEEAVDALLAQGYGNWLVETTTQTYQGRATKKLEALVSTERRETPVEVDRGHDRDKARLLDDDDPVFAALGITDERGRVKPTRVAKHRQVEEFLRLLETTVTDALDKGHLRRPTVEEPLRVVDLGCGNAYLTFAALRYLAGVRGLPVVVTGVDVKEQSREHNTAVAERLAAAGAFGDGRADFVVGSIQDVVLDPAPEVVLALHACDTATDDALGRAAAWEAPVALAAPCCHHDVAAQLRAAATPAPYAALTRHGILRERFADTLTDALRASLLRLEGYRVEVVEFVGSEHTPRNTLLRATRTGAAVGGEQREEYDELVRTWGVRPRLGELLAHRPG
ncbi:class I SAM-dependent methyltransferase [Nocardioides sp. AX2bis]|uniref:class I SAM-dependent methyltransferase n=1 Tax=Nocardioides sp. AX2bis TaxID=2653157 RepID=UPI0012F1CAFC|nr:SAM-dependent methyltransferase [Nocardioides sp. AX2bis]VXC17058.1 conserved hypothetical protein [Nocardioides sp. AX2bis]